MNTMNASRRRLIALAATTTLFLGGGAVPGRAAEGGGAAGFVQSLGTELVQIVNEPGDASAKRGELQPVIDRNVAVDEIARFCLGHYWQSATASQRQEYLGLFHTVLLNSILSHLGSYRGVRFEIGQAVPQPGGTHVETTILRPGEQPANVEWVVDDEPKVIDVVAEGTSLRTTQRGDYTSYLDRHGGDVSALIAALQRQTQRSS